MKDGFIMTRQVRHLRTSCKGKIFAAGSRPRVKLISTMSPLCSACRTHFKHGDSVFKCMQCDKIYCKRCHNALGRKCMANHGDELGIEVIEFNPKPRFMELEY